MQLAVHTHLQIQCKSLHFMVSQCTVVLFQCILSPLQQYGIPSPACEHSGTGGSKCEFALSYILELLACVNNVPPFSSAGPVLGHTELLACVTSLTSSLDAIGVARYVAYTQEHMMGVLLHTKFSTKNVSQLTYPGYCSQVHDLVLQARPHQCTPILVAA